MSIQRLAVTGAGQRSSVAAARLAQARSSGQSRGQSRGRGTGARTPAGEELRGSVQIAPRALEIVRWGRQVSLYATCLVLCAACIVRTTPPASRQEAGGAALTAPAPARLRLPPGVRPLRYRLELEIQPLQTVFKGRAEIEVAISTPLDEISLHAEGLSIDSAVVQSGWVEHVAKVVSARESEVTLLLPAAVSAAATLQITYRGRLRHNPSLVFRKEDVGIYTVWTLNGSIVFSRFEPEGARRAFPCFDEPAFKTPFEVVLRVPHGQHAVSNAPEVSRTTSRGQDLVTFASTPPLPTYLVAFAVGAFEELSAPVGDVPHRILTLPGGAAKARYAAAKAGPILSALTSYLDSPYPYAKLDQLAAPAFGAWAMENPGLVIYREQALLLGEDASPTSRQLLQDVMAHELAHMWFGNQVTLRWWDELWINESLPTWLGAKVGAEVEPQLQSSLLQLVRALSIKERDGFGHARPLRRHIAERKDIEAAWGTDVYDKGAAILTMIESWVGENRFRDGLRSHLARYAGGHAGAAELVASLEQASGKPVGELLIPFVEQPGIPLLSLDVICRADRVVLRYRQSRYHPAPGEPPAGGHWAIPACIRAFARDAEQTLCSLLDAPEGEIELEAAFCPDFFHPNAAEHGYYQWEISPRQVARLAAAGERLSLAERIALPARAAAAFEAGALSAETLRDVLRACARDPHSETLRAVLDVLDDIHWAWPVQAPREPLSRFARQLVDAHARRLGSWSRPEDSPADRWVRPRLMREGFELGAMQELRDTADRFVQTLWAGSDAVSPDDAAALLPIAAKGGGEELHSRLLSIDKYPWPLRGAVLRALGGFDNPRLLQRSLDGWLRRGTFHRSDFWTLVAAAEASPQRHHVLFEWYLEHASAVIRRLGSEAYQLPRLGAYSCSAREQVAARAHFSDHARFGESARDSLAEAEERAARCRVVREKRSASLVTALEHSSP